eukprot:853453-Pelagomonas_calceolata.AAC.1
MTAGEWFHPSRNSTIGQNASFVLTSGLPFDTRSCCHGLMSSGGKALEQQRCELCRDKISLQEALTWQRGVLWVR